MPARALLVADLQTAGVPDEPEATLELLKQPVHATSHLSSRC
jgi:hypothetical protein